MGRIYFDAPHGIAVISGVERHRFASTTRHLFEGLLYLRNRSTEWLKVFVNGLPEGHHCRSAFNNLKPYQFELGALTTAVAVSSVEPLTVYGIDIWHCQLNTAILFGNEAVKLATRIHAQCEIHGWIADHNRGKAANLIQQGLATGVYGSGNGWEDLIKLLRARESGDFVMSYSVWDRYDGLTCVNDPSLEVLTDELHPNLPFGVCWCDDGWDVVKLGQLIDFGVRGADIPAIIERYEAIDLDPHSAWAQVVAETQANLVQEVADGL